MDIFAIVNFGGEVFMFTWNLKKKKKQVAGLVLLASTSLLGLPSSFFCNILREELTEKMKSISWKDVPRSFSLAEFLGMPVSQGSKSQSHFRICLKSQSLFPETQHGLYTYPRFSQHLQSWSQTGSAGVESLFQERIFPGGSSISEQSTLRSSCRLREGR